MTNLELDQQTQQSVLDFLSFHPDGPLATALDEQDNYQAVADEVPNTIAQQTAVDLVEFLRSAGK